MGNSKPIGKNISGVEVTNISTHGIWLLSGDKELFLAYDHFPRFKDVSIGKIICASALTRGGADKTGHFCLIVICPEPEEIERFSTNLFWRRFMQVFLTGATGFIGQALVRIMRQRNWQVRTLVRDLDSPASHWLKAQGCQLVHGDVLQPKGLSQAMAGIDVLLHNAGIYELGVTRAAELRMQQVNVQGTSHVLGAALEAGVPRTVYVSTVWALGGSKLSEKPVSMLDENARHSGVYLSSYERSKAEAHLVALDWRKKGLPMVIGMPNGVVGINDHATFGYFLRLYLLHKMPPVAWGRNVVYSLVEVNALAQGLCLAAEKAPVGEDYVFCGPPHNFGRPV